MKRLYLTALLITGFILHTFSQTKTHTESARSTLTPIKLSIEHVKGLPANLYASINFSDDDDDGYLEAQEDAVITISISNASGLGPAQDVMIRISDSLKDPEITYRNNNLKIPVIEPGKTKKVDLRIHAGMDVKTAYNKFTILIDERNGYGYDPLALYVNTVTYQEPKLVVAGIDIVDQCKDCSPILPDGKLQKGEVVLARIVLQNQGQNFSEGTSYRITSTDNNVNIFKGDTGTIGTMESGASHDIWLQISPSKRFVKQDIPVYITVTNKIHRGELATSRLPLALDQTPKKPEIIEVKPVLTALNRPKYGQLPGKMEATIGNIDNIDQPTPSNQVRNDAVAVVIGVEEYNYMAPAKYAESDARHMEEYFKTRLGIPPGKIFKYTSREVNVGFFNKIFNPVYGELKNQINRGKTDLFVFYSGHGIPNEAGDTVYLMPSDGVEAGLKDYGFELGKFYRFLDELGAKNTIVILDACFTGVSRASESQPPANLLSMKGGARIPKVEPQLVNPWEKDPGFTVFTSSGYNKPSFSNERSKTGRFTYYVCLGLQGRADLDGNREITTFELGKYVSEQVMSETIKGKTQQPEMHGNPDYILLKD